MLVLRKPVGGHLLADPQDSREKFRSVFKNEIEYSYNHLRSYGMYRINSGGYVSYYRLNSLSMCNNLIEDVSELVAHLEEITLEEVFKPKEGEPRKYKVTYNPTLGILIEGERIRPDGYLIPPNLEESTLKAFKEIRAMAIRERGAIKSDLDELDKIKFMESELKPNHVEIARVDLFMRLLSMAKKPVKDGWFSEFVGCAEEIQFPIKHQGIFNRLVKDYSAKYQEAIKSDPCSIVIGGVDVDKA